MSLASLVLSTALAAVAGAEPDNAALIAKLGSAEPAERAAAAKALEALGREALPALRQASAAGDRDLRERAAALWDTIQRGLMTRPSLVQLNFPDRHVDRVLAELMNQTGLALEPDPSAGALLIEDVPGPGAGDVLGGDRAARAALRLAAGIGPRPVSEASSPLQAHLDVHHKRRPVPGVPDGLALASRHPIDARAVGPDRPDRAADRPPARGAHRRVRSVLRRPGGDGRASDAVHSGSPCTAHRGTRRPRSVAHPRGGRSRDQEQRGRAFRPRLRPRRDSREDRVPAPDSGTARTHRPSPWGRPRDASSPAARTFAGHPAGRCRRQDVPLRRRRVHDPVREVRTESDEHHHDRPTPSRQGRIARQHRRSSHHHAALFDGQLSAPTDRCRGDGPGVPDQQWQRQPHDSDGIRVV